MGGLCFYFSIVFKFVKGKRIVRGFIGYFILKKFFFIFIIKEKNLEL